MARLRNEAEARARELESVFDAITDAAFVYDRDGQIVRITPPRRPSSTSTTPPRTPHTRRSSAPN